MKKIFLTILATSILLNLGACSTTPQKNKNLVSNTLEVNSIQTPELLSQIDISSEYNAGDIRYNQDVNKNRKIFLEKMKKVGVECQAGYDNGAVGGDILCKNIIKYNLDYKIPSRHAIFRAPSFALSGSSFTPEWIPAVLFTGNRLYAIKEKYFYNQELRKRLANHSIDDNSDTSCQIITEKGEIKTINESCGETGETTLEEISDYREKYDNSKKLSFIEILVQHGLIHDEKDENLRWNLATGTNCGYELGFLDKETPIGLQCFQGNINIYYKSGYNYYYLYKKRIVSGGPISDIGFPRPLRLFIE